MKKVILAVLLTMIVLARAPIPTQVFIQVNKEIVVMTKAPPGSQIFEDEKEVLASITTFTYANAYKGMLKSMKMTTVLSTNQ